MKLTPTIDFRILEAYADGRRNVPVNIALLLDEKRNTVNPRHSRLRQQGLIRRIGPAETSGLYEITARGRAALQVQHRYGDPDTDFGSLITNRAADHYDQFTDHNDG